MTTKKYIDIYKNISFERTELFKAINSKYHPKSVLYPGSSIHISPSFIFQNVTYVDPSSIAAKFFNSKDEIIEFISKEAQYKQKPHLQYYNCSIEDLDDFYNEKFDLIFSSFSGNMIELSWKYLKYKGFYISNNHQNELSRIEYIKGATYLGYFSYKSGKYQFTDSKGLLTIKEPPEVSKDNKSSGIKYLNNELFYVIQKNHFRITTG